MHSHLPVKVRRESPCASNRSYDLAFLNALTFGYLNRVEMKVHATHSGSVAEYEGVAVHHSPGGKKHGGVGGALHGLAFPAGQVQALVPAFAPPVIEAAHTKPGRLRRHYRHLEFSAEKSRRLVRLQGVDDELVVGLVLRGIVVGQCRFADPQFLIAVTPFLDRDLSFPALFSLRYNQCFLGFCVERDRNDRFPIALGIAGEGVRLFFPGQLGSGLLLALGESNEECRSLIGIAGN